MPGMTFREFLALLEEEGTSSVSVDGTGWEGPGESGAGTYAAGVAGYSRPFLGYRPGRLPLLGKSHNMRSRRRKPS